MAHYESAALFNLSANDVTNRPLAVRLHDGAPGNNGTANRIGTIEEDVAASGWTAGSSGGSETTAETDFGELSPTDAFTVEAYSVWNGNTFLWWASVWQVGTTTVGVAVAAAEEFKMAAGEISITFS